MILVSFPLELLFSSSDVFENLIRKGLSILIFLYVKPHLELQFQIINTKSKDSFCNLLLIKHV